MKQWLKRGVGVAMLVAACGAAQAGDARQVYLGAFGQFVTPDGSRDQYRGGGAGALAGLVLGDHLSLEASGSLYSMQQDRDRSLYDRGAHLGLDLIIGNRRWHKYPYLIVGGGLLYEEIQLVDYLSGYLNAGAGLNFRLRPSGLALRAEVRGLAVFNDRAIAGEDLLYDGHARLALVYPLGGRSAGAEAAPPPPVSTVAHEPPAAGRLRVPDADGDGVPDAGDDCAATAPGVAVDFRGCAVDHDADGVPDHVDACRDTMRGFSVDERGCAVAQSVVLDRVNFEPNSAKLEFNARTLLDQLAAQLRGQPSMRIEVGGHTDSIGSQEYNLELSTRRAHAVRDYLIRAGIAADRIRAEGYGEFQPLADNDTAEGRAQNRRVEITVTP